jgi:hypothetical protein
MIEKEFIPYTESIELKELGFDEPCLGMFKFKKLCIDYPRITNNMLKKANLDNYCSAPTFSQALRFFRERYKLISWVESSYDEEYFPKIDEMRHPKEIDMDDLRILQFCKTYEEAELVCLKTLIKVVKNEK